MPSKYRITTDQGVFDVTVDDTPAAEQSAHQSSVGALPVAAASPALSMAANVASRVATSPTLPKTAATVGRVVGGVTSLPAGLSGFGDVQRGVWAGGRSGWFTGKLIQDVAMPIAKTLERLEPVARAVSQLSGAQGVNDLAQIAEPTRKDIGFLGLAPSQPDLDVLRAAVAKGANPTQAAAQLAGGDSTRFASLLTAYSQSIGQGR